ncbi:MAG: hypothetical protein Q4A89_02710 [Tannerella sp.]|nr:hypothetical protein [Tannerella sp.]
MKTIRRHGIKGAPLGWCIFIGMIVDAKENRTTKRFMEAPQETEIASIFSQG